jgi:ABC-type spermidine/putrescine transport system permease subunit I
MPQIKEWIVRSVWLAGILTLNCAVFGSLWSGLFALGDARGALWCQGIFWGFLSSWILNTIALIGLLTANVLIPSELKTKN